MLELNEAVRSAAETLVVACECADLGCVQTIEIAPAAYQAVRANPRRFVVLPGHVYPSVEDVVGESDGHVVVEKVAPGAAELAEDLAREA